MENRVNRKGILIYYINLVWLVNNAVSGMIKGSNTQSTEAAIQR